MCNDKKSSMICCDKKDQNKKGSGVVPCMLAGLMSGIAIGVIGKILLDSNKKQLMKKFSKMADAVEDLTDSAKNIFQ